MDDIELLVHISAPVRRQDDQRYLDLAQSIIDFEPVTLLRGDDAEKSVLDDIGDGSLVQHQLLSSSSPADDGGSHSPTPGAASALQSIRRPCMTASTKSNIDKPQSRLSREIPNPPYKNPYHGLVPLAQPRVVYDTPNQTRRPRTAPERLPNTVQVPRTGPNVRRSRSESASFSSLASHVSNSQPSDRPGLQEDGNSTPVPSSSWLRGDAGAHHKEITRTLSQTSLDDVQLPDKRRKTVGRAETEVRRIPRPPKTEAFLLLDRSLDWTSSTQSSQTESSSVTSTASVPPSQQDQNTDMHEPAKVTPPTIRISSESSEQADKRAMQQSESPNSSRESQKPDMTSNSGVIRDTSQCIGSKPLFEQLGLEPSISAPEPSVGAERFVTHITAPLQHFASRLPFTRFFRPVEVARDIQVLERGYWLMEVQIVSDDIAEAARSAERNKARAQRMHEGSTGVTAKERLRKHDEAKRNGGQYQSGQSSESKAEGLWTEDELVQFWKSFSAFIATGKAGWGTRLVGDDISDEPGEAVRLRIRIFTWGEVLGHLYLAIWVLSDKLAARIPMDWVASDGLHVVRMAGNRSGRGSLPPWSRKGPEGEKGRWGLEEET